jgi:hypothetical protein
MKKSKSEVEFLNFSKKVSRTKWATWFNCLTTQKKYLLFRFYISKKTTYAKNKKSFSDKKFFYNSKNGLFKVNISEMRNSVLEQLLS